MLRRKEWKGSSWEQQLPPPPPLHVAAIEFKLIYYKIHRGCVTPSDYNFHQNPLRMPYVNETGEEGIRKDENHFRLHCTVMEHNNNHNTACLRCVWKEKVTDWRWQKWNYTTGRKQSEKEILIVLSEIEISVCVCSFYSSFLLRILLLPALTVHAFVYLYENPFSAHTFRNPFLILYGYCLMNRK